MKISLPHFLYIIISVSSFFPFSTNAETTKIKREDIVQYVETISKQCERKSFNDNLSSTQDMITASTNMNICIEDILQKEIKSVFNDIDKENNAWKHIQNLKKETLGYYWMLYNENKYCYCGTMAQPINLSAWTEHLKQILIETILINRNKGF